MARALAFTYGVAELSFELEIVDRSRLYGYVDIEALDDKKRPCELVVLADDGQTLVGPGGTAFGMLSPSGDWLDKSTLKPVDSEGKEITPVPSSFSAPIPLKKKTTIEDYLSHNIKGVYRLHIEKMVPKLADELKNGTIYRFSYSYRGGLEPDVGFLLAAQDGNVFLAVGQPTTIQFIGFEPVAWLAEVDGGEIDKDQEIDFGMM